MNCEPLLLRRRGGGGRLRAAHGLRRAPRDDEREPDAKNVLRRSCDEAGVMAEIEVYEGAAHGWTVPDSDVYHEQQTERVWDRMLALFETALA